MTKTGKGILAGIAAYLIWGFSPLFWKLIQNVPAMEIVAHRILWSFTFIIIVNIILNNWSWLKDVKTDSSILIKVFVTGFLLSLNWIVYIYAVNSDMIVDASLGYFINPLVNVVLGVIFFKERLRIWQWIPVFMASFGVLYITIQHGSLPWIGLVLAFSFGIYGLMKKRTGLSSFDSFSLEMGILILPALLGLIWGLTLDSGGWNFDKPIIFFLLASTGLVTGVPLVLFGVAAKRIQLSTLGFIQYIAPTLQFLIGILIFKEHLSIDRIIGFGLIWLAILIYSIEGVLKNSRKSRPVPFQ